MKWQRQSLVFCFLVLLFCAPLPSQEKEAAPPAKDELATPENVVVTPEANDSEIKTRLERILEATGWFVSPKVQVQEGVVFIEGRTDSDAHKQWAGDLARKTQDVNAVVNRIDVRPPTWDYSKALTTVSALGRKIVHALPSIVFGIVILAAAWGAALLVAACARFLLKKRIRNPLLRRLIASAIGVLVFLLGVYVVFEVAGLTTVAMTIIGGTGLLGIVLGIAFKDISENLLASVFLSVQQPFRQGDLIEVAGNTGFVQSLTMRATILLSLEGLEIQIPNATVYKAAIHNSSCHPKRRVDFVIEIGYEDSVPEAQAIAQAILKEHEGVLDTPEPWVLIDTLAKSGINLKIYFWVDTTQYNFMKVKSSVIRLVKKGFMEHKITLPDEARERIFPKEKLERSEKTSLGESNAAESGLENGGAKEMQQQAKPKDNEGNLLS